jgi:hypothetical protein
MNIPNELSKIILIKQTTKNALDFKFPKSMVNIGINQLYYFEYTVNKIPKKNIAITDYKITLKGNDYFNIKNELNNSRNNSLSEKNQIDNNRVRDKKKKVESFHTSSKNINEDQSSLIKIMFGNDNKKHRSYEEIDISSSEVSPLPPLFYVFNEKNNNIEEYKDCYERKYENYESKLENGENKDDVLIKFTQFGLYKISLLIQYFIKHEITGDILEFNNENNFYFKVMSPLKLTNTIKTNNYLICNKDNKKQNEYFTDTNIEMFLHFNNVLDEDIIIKDIILNLDENVLNENTTEINTTLKDIIDNKDIEEDIKEDIFTIFKKLDYSIPFNLRFNKPFNGSIGKCKIIWTTKYLQEFQRNKIKDNSNINLYNENEFEFPTLKINSLELNYKYQQIINDNIIILKFKIQNKSNDRKILKIKIENEADLLINISGMLKAKVLIKSKESIKFILKLNVLINGEIKLPNLVISEMDDQGNELLTNVYNMGKIIFNKN